MPEGAAELAVGDGLQADLLLPPDNLADLLVLDRLQLAGEHVPRAKLLTGTRPGVGARVLLLVLAFAAQIDALVAGEIDVLDIGPDANKYKRASQTPGIDLRKAGGPNFRHVTIQGTSPFLSDLKVRKAVALGIDRDAISRAALTPVGVPPEPLGNRIFMKNQAAYEDNSGEFKKQDLAKARELLDEAGWKLEGNVRKKNGQELKLRFVIPTGVEISTQESQLIQNQLKALGIVIDIQTVPVSDFFPEYIEKGNYDLTVFSWIGTVFPLSSSKSNYVKPKQGPNGLIVQQNYARIGSDEIDKLYAEGTQLFEKAEKAEVGNKIDELLWGEVHSLPLYQRPEIVAVKENLANIGASGFASQPVEDVGYLKEGA
jgi:peptide/nickel transport system substrate-binding protein